MASECSVIGCAAFAHECETVRDAGFSGKENRELLALAERALRHPRHNKQEHSVSAEHNGTEHLGLDHPPSFERSGFIPAC
jgi:hypothetical protein